MLEISIKYKNLNSKRNHKMDLLICPYQTDLWKFKNSILLICFFYEFWKKLSTVCYLKHLSFIALKPIRGWVTDFIMVVVYHLSYYNIRTMLNGVSLYPSIVNTDSSTSSKKTKYHPYQIHTCSTANPFHPIFHIYDTKGLQRVLCLIHFISERWELWACVCHGNLDILLLNKSVISKYILQ